MASTRLASAALAALVSTSLIAPRPASADGAASTRNIIFGAAAIGGTLLILNHNKKVHEKYAEYDRRQAETESERNQAQAAYDSERGAYEHEATLVSEYRQETAYQHSQVVARDRQIASLEHSLVVAKYGAAHRTALVAAPAGRVAVHAAPRRREQPPQPRAVAVERPASVVSYGWGNY